MSWVTPRTWAVGEKVTAALMNEQLRDNTTWLKASQDSAQNYASSGTYSYNGVVATLNITGASLSYTPKTNRAIVMVAASMTNDGGNVTSAANGVIAALGYKVNAGSNNLMFAEGSRINQGSDQFRKTTQTGIAIVTVTPNSALTLQATITVTGYTSSAITYVYSLQMVIQDFRNV